METETLAQSIDTPDPDWVAVLLRDYCVDQGDYSVSPVSIQLDRLGIDAPKVRRTCEDARLAGYYAQEISDAVRHLWAFGMSSQDIARVLSVTPETVRQVLREARWSQEEACSILLHIQGFTPQEISQALSKTRGWVYYIFDIHGVTPNRKNRTATDRGQKREIIRRYDMGDNAKRIASDLNLEPHQVYWAVAKARMDGQRVPT